VKTAAFAEVNPTRNGEMPSALLEWAFHDLESDVALMLEPEFRQDTARALYRAIVRYFAERDGHAAVFLPEAPVGVAALQEVPGTVALSWSAGPVGDPYGDAPTGYRAYHSVDGRSWDNGVAVDGLSHTLEIDPGQHFFRVAALNAGGASFASEIVGIRSTPDPVQPVLIVAAFDRQQASMLPWEPVGRAVGDVRRMDLSRMNQFDIAVAHGRALKALGWGFDTISDERLGDVDLSQYKVVIWAAGEESTADESFSHAQQAAIRSYVEGGGRLIVSGAEILWDLDERGDAQDRSFAAEVLGASLADDNSGSTQVTGAGILAGLVLDFAESDGAPYPVEFPDVLSASGSPLAVYGTGDLAGVLTGNVALFGFPLETIGSEAARSEALGAVLQALVPDYTVPSGTGGGIGEDTGDTGGSGGETKGSCACSTTANASSWWPWGLILLVGLMRSRRASGVSLADLSWANPAR
jgi:MYXO-CTERM domain-containing protein